MDTNTAVSNNKFIQKFQVFFSQSLQEILKMSSVTQHREEESDSILNNYFKSTCVYYLDIETFAILFLMFIEAIVLFYPKICSQNFKTLITYNHIYYNHTLITIYIYIYIYVYTYV